SRYRNLALCGALSLSKFG
ncbi:hypothetical protein Zm00014a_012556, partial [Zea mays]